MLEVTAEIASQLLVRMMFCRTVRIRCRVVSPEGSGVLVETLGMSGEMAMPNLVAAKNLKISRYRSAGSVSMGLRARHLR